MSFNLIADLAKNRQHRRPDAAAAARLEAFASANTEMVQATRTVVFSRGQQLQRDRTSPFASANMPTPRRVAS